MNAQEKQDRFDSWFCPIHKRNNIVYIGSERIGCNGFIDSKTPGFTVPDRWIITCQYSAHAEDISCPLVFGLF